MERVIYLCRHGHIDVGSEKRYIGVTDLPLSQKGFAQAGRLLRYFSGITIEKAYTSPLNRCIQTSDILLKGRNTKSIIINEIKEINMGEWENQPVDHIKRLFPEQYEKRGQNIDTFIPPKGESFNQLQKRVMPGFEYICRSTSGNILIVSHAGVNRVILSKLLDFPLKDIFSINQPYGCINKLIQDEKSHKWHLEQLQSE